MVLQMELRPSCLLHKLFPIGQALESVFLTLFQMAWTNSLEASLFSESQLGGLPPGMVLSTRGQGPAAAD